VRITPLTHNGLECLRYLAVVCGAFTVICCGSSVVAASDDAALLLLLFLLLVMYCSRQFFVSAESRVRLCNSVSTSTSKLQLSFSSHRLV